MSASQIWALRTCAIEEPAASSVSFRFFKMNSVWRRMDEPSQKMPFTWASAGMPVRKSVAICPATKT